MSNKIALVTGSSRGIGLAIAKELSYRNINVHISGRSKQQLELAKKELKNPENHVCFCGDLTDNYKLNELLQSLELSNITPDFIIHNLGGKIPGDKQPLHPTALRESLKLNLEISVAINSFFLPKMQLRNYGRIIHISTDAGLTGKAAPGYAAAKSAIHGYIKSTARFYVKHNIMMCAILPGIVLHPGSAWEKKDKEAPEYYQKRLEQMPLGRFSTPSEVAQITADVITSNNILYAGSLLDITAAL